MCDDEAGRAGVDRRALLRTGLAGAGLTTVAALARFEPAAAGTSTTRHFSGSFDGVTNPDWHYLPFHVPAGVREIEVSYAYEKTDTGAGFSADVVDIGLFDASGHGLGDAEGFRGWSGGARTHFRVSRTSATPGYLPGPIGPGTWSVILGPFLVVPPGVSWTVDVTLHFGEPGPRFVAHPAPRRVPGTGPGWYRGDLHTHTVHSDGRWTQRTLAAAARAAGLDFIGSAEHNTSTAPLSWGRFAPDDLLVLAGEEITTRAGHWVAMGLPAGTWIDWRYRAADGELARFTDRVRALCGIAIAAHPFVPIPGTRWDFGYDYAAMDAIEIWNGPWTLDDQVGVEHWHAMLVAGTFVPVVGNSDSHHDGQTVGLAQTVVHASSLSTGAIVRALRRGRAWLAESSAVDLTFTASDGIRTVSCGEHLGAAVSDLVQVRLAVRGAPTCLAQVLGPAGVLGGQVIGPDGTAVLTVDVPVAAIAFVRAEVRRLDAAPVVNPLEGVPALPMVAMTNPVFLT